MVDVYALRGLIVEHGYNNGTFSDSVGIERHTFSRCLKRKRFDSDQMFRIKEKLSMDNDMCVRVFFAEE